MATPVRVLSLPSTQQAPRLARDYVHELGEFWPPEVLDNLLLAVSEVVTNAVRYGQGRLELRVEVSSLTVRVEVSDANPQRPQQRPLPRDGLVESGLGLHLLDALSAGWGCRTRPDPPGKTVWVELSLWPEQPPS